MCDFIHKTRHYPPINYTPKNNIIINNLQDYFTLEYAHCSHKPKALQVLLSHFNIHSKVCGYTNLLGWAHGFLEVTHNDVSYILDPTFNMYMNINTNTLIKDPYSTRKILQFSSNEFYIDNLDSYTNFICGMLNHEYHTTYKYSREWFKFIGFYPYVAPIFQLSQENSIIYDIRLDSRFSLS